MRRSPNATAHTNQPGDCDRPFRLLWKNGGNGGVCVSALVTSFESGAAAGYHSRRDDGNGSAGRVNDKNNQQYQNHDDNDDNVVGTVMEKSFDEVSTIRGSSSDEENHHHHHDGGKGPKDDSTNKSNTNDSEKSFAGKDVESLGISLDGESLLMPTTTANVSSSLGVVVVTSAGAVDHKESHDKTILGRLIGGGVGTSNSKLNYSKSTLEADAAALASDDDHDQEGNLQKEIQSLSLSSSSRQQRQRQRRQQQQQLQQTHCPTTKEATTSNKTIRNCHPLTTNTINDSTPKLFFTATPPRIVLPGPSKYYHQNNVRRSNRHFSHHHRRPCSSNSSSESREGPLSLASRLAKHEKKHNQQKEEEEKAEEDLNDVPPTGSGRRGSDDRGSDDEACVGSGCPVWIVEAPFYLKVYILGALILFFGSVTLTVYTTLELGGIHVRSHGHHTNNDDNNHPGSIMGSSTSDEFVPPPPVVSPTPSAAPSVSHRTNTKSKPPTAVTNTTNNNSKPPTTVVSNTNRTSRSPLLPLDTNWFHTTAISFYVIAGSTRPSLLSLQLSQLPAHQTAQNEGEETKNGNTTEHANGNSTNAHSSSQVYSAPPFLVHLGSWNTPQSNTTMSNPDDAATGLASLTGLSCSESRYQAMARQYSNSSVPAFFVLGDEEFMDCPMPNQARQYWRDYLGNYNVHNSSYKRDHIAEDGNDKTNNNNNYHHNNTLDDPEWHYRAKPGQPEQFSFVLGTVLFVGVHIPQPRTESSSNRNSPNNDGGGGGDWDIHYASENLAWIQENYHFVQDGGGNIHVMVVFTNSPFYVTRAGTDWWWSSSNSVFYFELMEQIVTDYQQVHVIVVHHPPYRRHSRGRYPNTTEPSAMSMSTSLYHQQSQFQGIPNLDVISVQGSVWPPMKVDLIVQMPSTSSEDQGGEEKDPTSTGISNTARVSVAVDQDQWFNEFVRDNT